MSIQRRRCLDSFYANSCSNVVLVESHNLSRWLVSDLHLHIICHLRIEPITFDVILCIITVVVIQI